MAPQDPRSATTASLEAGMGASSRMAEIGVVLCLMALSLVCRWTEAT